MTLEALAGYTGCLVDDSDEPLVHLECCTVDLGLCGEDLTGGDYTFTDDDPDAVTCRACAHLDRVGVRCGMRFCRVRGWWRSRWWS
jgi:hypothetical protein